MRYFQINTIAPPDTIPASAPHLFVRFQKRAQRINGPKAAPNPAHAKDTIAKTELSGLEAMITPITEITIKVTLAIIMEAFSLKSFTNTSFTIFCDTPEAAAKSCESAVDIIAARIPHKNKPPINGILH